MDDEIEVTGRASDMLGIAESASEGVTGREDLEKRPVLRPGELLEAVPGVIVTQHSGSGKANQCFLRGFNLDHGTDFRMTVDGIPVNLATHGHGQGYSDLSFLIPEVVERIHYKKGSYYSEEGDFATAGAADIEYSTELEKGVLLLAPGDHGYQRALIADSVDLGRGTVLGAFELQRNDGPWTRPDDYQKVNGVLRFNSGGASRGFTLTAMGYNGEWNATDQIPERALRSGLLGRYDAVDQTSGGSSHRFSLATDFRWDREERLNRLRLYVIDYKLDLFSNFTYFLDDPENGDQFAQKDDRVAVGFDLHGDWMTEWGGRTVQVTAGIQGRGDDIKNGLFRSRERVLLGAIREDDVTQGLLGAHAHAHVRWNSWLRMIAGLRADSFYAEVDSDLPVNSGSIDDFLLSPKLSLLFGPWQATELYVNAGTGFHSNDARGATIRIDPRSVEAVGRVEPLVRGKSFDVGLRTERIPSLQTAITFFSLELESELVFIGDAGGTEASRPSRRTGVELQNFWRPKPWLSVDADLALSRGRFTDADPAGDRIPGSIETAVAAGISVDDLRNVFGSLRLRYFGPRPLIEDNSVRSASSTLVNALVGYEFANGVRLAVEAFNLFNETASDIEYYYESRLPGEPEPVADIHFHPAEERSFRLVADWRF